MNTLFERFISTASDLVTLIASSIAIFLFLFKREPIISALKVLINYSKQLTLTDLKSKIDRLNDHNANDEKQIEEVINILHEIEGQINGNKNLKVEFVDFLKKIITFTSGKKLITEPLKRSLVHELRELLRNINIENSLSLTNKKK